MISVLLPEPETPVMQTNLPSGIATSMFLRLFSRAPLIADRVAVAGPALVRHRDAARAGEVGAGDRLRVGHDLIGRALGNDLAAVLAGAGAHVDQVVGGAHHRFVVLDDDHGVAEVAQAFERADQARVVGGVQADSRLVADVEHTHQPGADLRREADALRLAAGERRRATVERQVVEADFDQEVEPGADLLQHLVGDRLLTRIAERRVRPTPGAQTTAARR